jgi:hypothetical protein
MKKMIQAPSTAGRSRGTVIRRRTVVPLAPATIAASS